MKKFIERMNGSIEEQQVLRRGPSSTTKESKKKWGVFSSRKKGGEKPPGPTGDEEEIEGMRVDFYLVVFLKFFGCIIPTIDIDSTAAF